VQIVKDLVNQVCPSGTLEHKEGGIGEHAPAKKKKKSKRRKKKSKKVSQDKLDSGNHCKGKNFKKKEEEFTEYGNKVFDDFFDKDIANEGTPQGNLHKSVHTFRGDFEDVRECLLDFNDSVNDVKEMVHTPEELAEEADSLVKTLTVIEQLGSKVKGGGPMVKVIQDALIKALHAVKSATEKTASKLRNMKTKFRLEEKEKSIDKFQKKFQRKAPFQKFEKLNGHLADFEEVTLDVAYAWPQVKGSGMVPGDVVTKVEQGMSKASTIINEANYLRGPARVARHMSSAFNVTEKILGPKRRFVSIIYPATHFFDWLTKKLKWLFDKVVGWLLGLPIVKKVIDWVENAFNWLWDKIMVNTGLDKLLESIGYYFNPFNLLKLTDFEAIKQLNALTGGLDYHEALKELPVQIVPLKKYAPDYDGTLHVLMPMKPKDRTYLDARCDVEKAAFM